MTAPFDEMTNADGSVREPYVVLDAWLKEQPPEALSLMSADAESIFRRLGITFAVYGSDEGTEKLIPFDVIPRIISAMEWRQAEQGHRAAGAGAQRVPPRHLPPPGDPQGRAGSRKS